MSKRFGRNQKRRMREELASLNLSMSALYRMREMDVALMERQRNTIQATDDVLKRVEKLLGKHTALLPPKSISTSGGHRTDGLFEMRAEAYAFSPPGEPGNDLAFSRTATISRLHYVLSRLKKDELPDFGVHVVVDFADRKAAYAATRSAIDHMDKRALTQYISESIASHIVNEL